MYCGHRVFWIFCQATLWVPVINKNTTDFKWKCSLSADFSEHLWLFIMFQSFYYLYQFYRDSCYINRKNVREGLISLRGRRSKGKGKGITARDHARGRREEGNPPSFLARPSRSLARKTPFHKAPFPFPFKRLPRRLGPNNNLVNLGIFEAQHQTNCNRIVFNAI